ncbi:unnamed protein product [Brassica rapa subsp. narinosa]
MHSFRISPNPGTKSVKENATKQPAFANLETVFVRKQCCNNVAKCDTWCELHNPVNHRVFDASCAPSLLAEGTSAWVSQIVVPPSSQ